VSEPIDLSDQELASWFYHWFRKLAYEQVGCRKLVCINDLPRGVVKSIWQQVLFRALDRFPGESSERIRDVFDRTADAVARMPKPIRWNFGERI
jgi:hypothetical protein